MKKKKRTAPKKNISKRKKKTKIKYAFGKFQVQSLANIGISANKGDS
jgi:hypothetical protein